MARPTLPTDSPTPGVTKRHSTDHGTLVKAIRETWDELDAAGIPAVATAPVGRVLTAAGDGSASFQPLPDVAGAVASVNGKTGVVVLTPADVGAAPAGAAPAVHTHVATDISNSTAVGRSVLTAATAAAARTAIGAAAAGGSTGYDALPPGVVIDVRESAGTYTRPTTRADLTVLFTGVSSPASVALDHDKWDQIT